MEQRYRWKNKQIREQIDVLDGKRSPTILLKNACYLNQVLRCWMTANIWIYGDRIVYVGEQLPKLIDKCEVVDCTGLKLVPGYIEPHVHPFQLYNPHSFACYTSQYGVTTTINDNMALVLHLEKKKAFSLIKELQKCPTTMYWWCRFDPQTEIMDEESVFSHGNIKSWLEHDGVLQGGELTGWPKLLDGDDMMLHWIQETKRLRKKVEGHFPGASEKTLAKMMLFGADCDHEAMTGQDILKRILQGYTVSLRNSSIRPDLQTILKEIHDLGVRCYDHMMFNTDGSTSSFYQDGVIDKMIRIALHEGVPVIDAYNMATINPAKYFHIESLHGMIATGRIADINFLSDEQNPTPVSVLAKGKWVKRENVDQHEFNIMSWERHGFAPLTIEWELTSDDLQFSMPFGMEMQNAVITKPYSVAIDMSGDELSTEHNECYFMLIDRKGKWRINTLLKGFANQLLGFASSFSNTGDIIIIGKNKQDMMIAFNRMKELGGGIVIVEHQKVIHEIPLPLSGIMSNEPISILMKEEQKLFSILKERGYSFVDPIYTLLFFSSTHLPYIRITPRGLYDVMNKMILFPSIMR